MKLLYCLLFFTAVYGIEINAQNYISFIEFVGTDFSEYHQHIENEILKCSNNESYSRDTIFNRLLEAAHVDQTPEWGIIARFIGNRIRFFKSRNSGTPSFYLVEDYISDNLKLADEAEQYSFVHLQLWIIFNVAEACKIYVKNYEKAFEHYIFVVEKLKNIPTTEFPLRSHVICDLANLYFEFREYEKAELYFRMLTDEERSDNINFEQNISALNGLGLCYRMMYDDKTESDKCFEKIIAVCETDDKTDYVWRGIAEGNIGYNRYLEKKYDEALPILLSAIDKIKRPNDFPYISTRALVIADIYLRKGETVLAKKYIDMSQNYSDKMKITEKNDLYYIVMNKYYASLDNIGLAAAYIDSVIIATKMHNEAYSGLVLRRVEQRLNAAEQKVREEELHAEKIRVKAYRQLFITISVFFMAVIVLLIILLTLYRKKRSAYRELAAKSREWASVKSKEQETALTKELEEKKNEKIAVLNGKEKSDKQLMKQLREIIEDERLYTDPYLTLNNTAQKLNTNRTYLSETINRTCGKNFTSFINEYRVKEAVRILSDKKYDYFLMDEVAERTGFATRKTFYEAFKKVTGLSPSAFKKNRGK